MILADKIMMLRKKCGWSQEELAEKLNVSRQSVSKWEGAQSIPDLEKILTMSKLFGVSTDFLMKDEMEMEEPVKEAVDDATIRKVSMEDANRFLKVKRETAKPIAFGVFLCIISPICLFVLGAMSEVEKYPITENMASGIGMVTLFVLIAIAAAIFIPCGMKTKEFEYLENEKIETEYGVIGMVKERKKQYGATYTRYNVFGTLLCICSLIPLFGGVVFSEEDVFMVSMLAIMLVLVGLGTIFFILAGIRNASFEKLLQEGDYSVEKKEKKGGIIGAITTAYWLLVTAGFLCYSLPRNNWRDSYIIWPVAGVVYAALVVVLNAIQNSKKNK